MQIIPPVAIGLLVDHAEVPSRGAILGHFADHYRASLDRAAAAAAADEADALAPEGLYEANEPLADLEELAAGAVAPAEMAHAASHTDEPEGLGGFTLEEPSFDLGDGPFASLDDDAGVGGDVFALADEPSGGVSDLLDDEAALSGSDERALDGAGAAPVDAGGAGAADVLDDEAFLAGFDGEDEDAVLDDAEAYELGLAPEGDVPSVVLSVDEELEALLAEAEPEDATSMIRALPDEAAEPDDATSMIQTMPEEAAEPDDATSMIQAMPDDDGHSDNEEAAGDGPTEGGETTDRPTRRSRRASRKSKKK